MQTTAEIGVPSSTPEPGRKAHSQVLAVLAVALVSRLLVVWFAAARFPHGWLYSRGIELGTLAQSLVEGHGLSSPFGGSTGATALLAPGYPTVIALVFRIFGSFTYSSAVAVMVMQTFFSVLTVWAIMRVASRCFGIPTANIAGLFWAISLPLLWMPTIFWETCLSTLFLVGMVDLALGCLPGLSSARWILMGMLCGLAGLVNPALILTLLLVYGWAIWQQRQQSLIRPLLGLLTFLLLFTPWPIRNAHALHAFIPLRSTVGFELWVGNRAGATGYLDESQFPIFNKWEYDSYIAKGEVLYMQNKSHLAKGYIYAHPVAFLLLSTVRFFRFWTGTGTKDGSPVFAIHAILTTFFGSLGIWRLVRRRRLRLVVLFGLPLALFPLPYYITHAEFRYRLVIDPVLTLLAAYAITASRGDSDEGNACLPVAITSTL
jgi:4-amino-4-deoxy-L-arabinose transferase-like glycosyltransferase